MRKLFVCIALGLTTLTGNAASPLWMRDVQISPDGTEIAFCYKGDIYKVSAGGGTAIQLTTQPSYECTPIWSPDSKQIAFASDRNGNFDIFVMPATGGTAQRLTTHSSSELPSAFTPDGKYILFSASIQDPSQSALFPTTAMTELYKVPVNGGRTEQVLGTPAEAVCYAPSGEFFLYQDRKGFEDEWRKHHTSSITRDIWLYDTKTGKHTNLTNHAGEDRNPVLSPDGKSVYLLSERKGSFNVYSFPLDNAQDLKAVTSFKTHPVRFLSMSHGGTLCYAYDGEIYTQKDNATPQKINIDIVRDDQDKIADLTFTNGATSGTVSPDGKQIAFIVRGEVFVTSTDYATTKQITHTPAREAGLTFAPDNRTLAYASERNGNWQLFLAKIARKEEANFPNATIIEEEVLLPSATVERAYPQFSPDGKELAFIEERNRLMVINLDTKKVRQITDGSTWFSTDGNFDYQWSPDGKWFTLEFIGNRHDPYSDIGLVSAKGDSPITNLTNSGYMSGSPRWVLDGNAILFTTERYGMRAHASWGSQNDAMLVFLNQDAFDKFRLSKEDYELQKELEKEQQKDKEKASIDPKKDKKTDPQTDTEKKDEIKNILVELNGLEDRIIRLTPNSSNLGSTIISKDGETLYYLSAFEGGFDLWKMDLRKKETKLLHKMNAGWASMDMDKDGKSLFVLGGNTMQKMDLSGETLKPINYKAEMKMDLAAEREYMFDHVYKQQQKRFYNTNMHGCDWDATIKNYRKFLPHINNNYDFSYMLSEVLGELNASHTGSRYYPNGSAETTAQLGLFFDWNYTGKGLKVSEVVEYGPFDRAKSKVRPGTIITKINGTDITVENDYTTLLNGQVGKKVLVTCKNASGEWEEVVKPISAGMNNALLYKRWVKRQEALCDSLSGGRLGYVHLQQMNDNSYREIYEKVLGEYNKKDGIVIDTRFNGGGRLHEDIQILFSGEKYLTQVVRGREACDMPSRRWNRPTIMLQCEANYSNAHGTPWVYKHTGMGKLVGMPVPGTMTSVNWITMQDESLIFGIPIIGYRLADGSYLENQQLDPDIRVANDPAVIVTGRDQQLEAAVKELLQEIDAKK